MDCHWISGPTRSGKTARLIQQLGRWGEAGLVREGQTFLMFAATGSTRLTLAERLAAELRGRLPVRTTTPAGFIQDEVTLFWPLLVQSQALQAQFPLVLRPENEQDLAAQLWQEDMASGKLAVQGWLEPQLVRRSLDLLQLAASAAVPAEDLPVLLPEGMPPGFADPHQWQAIGGALGRWRDWCLERGLITYGVMTELYWRRLLPQPAYQEQLRTRFSAVVADDLDEYPPVAGQCLQVLRQLGLPSAYSWNAQGQVRLGLGADPDRLASLAAGCEHETLPPLDNSLAYAWADTLVDWVQDPLALPEPVPPLQNLQCTSRAELLRATATAVAATVQRGVDPSQVAIIAPGLDAIARYSLTEILASQDIPVNSLNAQRPLNSSPVVRALLTLLPLLYPGLGRLCDRNSIADMLVVLSSAPADSSSRWGENPRIDPVRAQLLADHCFQADLQQPQLLPMERFPRWDRLGHRAATAYGELLEWIAQQRQQQQQRLVPNAISLLDRAIQQFLQGGSCLPYDQLSALRELMETAQRYRDIHQRLQRFQRSSPAAEPVGRFIQLLRQGTVSANPYPVQPTRPGVTLATVFQYRSQRLAHPWQFWLDAGSPRWLTGTDALFGFPIFLKSYGGRPWSITQIEQLHQQRLERILRDLLGRAQEQVVLCHSDLAVSGQEQLGPLLPLVTGAAQPWELDSP